MRLLVAVLVLATTFAPGAQAQKRPALRGLPATMRTAVADAATGTKSLLAEAAESGLVFAVHPKGDTQVLPCPHLVAEHPGGHGGGTGPCLHPPVAKHPGGHKQWTPCADPRHASRKGPCKGHEKTVPCAHLEAPHGSDPLPTVPCGHLKKEHPGGHPNTGPCVHELRPVETDKGRGLIFYESTPAFRSRVKGWVDTLQGWGIRFGTPRVLHVFQRPFRDGPYPDAYGSDAGRDPFWSHYSPIEKKGRHYLQVAREHGDSTAAHELGHAIAGDKCVVLASLGGSHLVEGEAAPGLALSEGWGDFVSAALLLDPAAAAPRWPFSPDSSFDMEAGQKVGATAPGPRSQRRELSVAYAFWDLFDRRADGADNDSLPFPTLFRVLQPTLATLTKGPLVRDFHDFVARLAKNEPSKAAFLRAVRDQNAP